MVREYVGRVTINGKRHEMADVSREAVAGALRMVTDTAAAMGWEIRDTAIMTRLRSSITGRVIGHRMQTRLNASGLEVVV